MCGDILDSLCVERLDARLKIEPTAHHHDNVASNRGFRRERVCTYFYVRKKLYAARTPHAGDDV